MGKATGFLDYDRKENAGQEPLERIKTYREFNKFLISSLTVYTSIGSNFYNTVSNSLKNFMVMGR